jgi:hypothetical protein
MLLSEESFPHYDQTVKRRKEKLEKFQRLDESQKTPIIKNPLSPPCTLRKNKAKNSCKHVKNDKTLEEKFSLSKNCLGGIFFKALTNFNFGALIVNSSFQIFRSSGLGREGMRRMNNAFDKAEMTPPKNYFYFNQYGYKHAGNLKVAVAALTPGVDPTIQRAFATQQESYVQRWNLMHESPDAKIKFFHPLSPIEAQRNVLFGGMSPDQEIIRKEISKITSPKTRSHLLGDHERTMKPAQTMETVAQKYTQEITGSGENFMESLKTIVGKGDVKLKGATVFHCKGGIHRTGMMALAIRYLQGGDWTKNFSAPIQVEASSEETKGIKRVKKSAQKALALKRKFYVRNWAEYEYYKHNQRLFRPENLEFLEKLSKTSEFQGLQLEVKDKLNSTEPPVLDHKEGEFDCAGKAPKVF